jgi:hypothetical protein
VLLKLPRFASLRSVELRINLLGHW